MSWRGPQQLQIRRQLWRAFEELPSCRRGIKMLGTPLGYQDFVTVQLEMLTAVHKTLLFPTPLVQGVQAAWLLWSDRYMAKVVEPGFAEPFCRRHDAQLCQCLCTILQISPN